MRSFRFLLFPIVLLLSPLAVSAQCGAGEVSVTINVHTDDFGYESYWQLVPTGNSCGVGTIYAAGNDSVGCDGGALQLQHMGGYGNNLTISEGPFCLTDGGSYDLIAIDDWGDSGPVYDVLINGISAYQFATLGGLQVNSFIAQLPPARDMSVTALTTSLYAHVGDNIAVRGVIKNVGSTDITTFDLSYKVDDGAPVTAPINGVTIAPGSTYEFTHPTAFVPVGTGDHTLTVWASGVNGNMDMNTANDMMSSQHVISPAIPDLAGLYLAVPPLVTVVANSDQDIAIPRDLAFHPDATRNELWVINKETEDFGGSTVTFYHPDGTDMTFDWRHDQNAWHFMSLPTGIAMGDNNCFATCPGVFDANHNGGDPFTGPTLWSADTAIYARFYGGLGSHLDMLHVDPNSQGIAHDHWNRYWVVDGFRGDIVMNDFRADHGPGNDYHGDAIIKRYADFSITKDPNDHVVSHDVLDKRNGWLYVVDFGGQRVLRMNTNTGSVSGPGLYGPWENYVDYSMVTGYDWDAIITTGLIEPSGIELVGDHLYVSDHANGDIIIYDISAPNTPELGRIHTDLPGLMGITVGPDGRIWGVNATYSELLRIDPQTSTSATAAQRNDMPRCWPNPADERLIVELPADLPTSAHYALRDPAGRTVIEGAIQGRVDQLSVSTLTSGTYSLEIRAASMRLSTNVVVMH